MIQYGDCLVVVVILWFCMILEIILRGRPQIVARPLTEIFALKSTVWNSAFSDDDRYDK